jgi:LemA protein
MRSKGVLFILVIVIIAGLGGCYGCASYNGIVSVDESVSQAWSDVENQYQRRADLVPRLIAVVESAASVDEALIKSVRESQEAARQSAVGDPSDTDGLQRFAEMQQRLSSSLASLTEAVQGDQGLQSIEAHRDLLVQLEGTENRIAVARRNYNDIVADYNQTVRRFPKNLIAGLFGFDTRSGFTAETK